MGIDRAKMRLFDVKMDQQDIVDSNQTTEEDTFAEPVFDKTDPLVKDGKFKDD